MLKWRTALYQNIEWVRILIQRTHIQNIRTTHTFDEVQLTFFCFWIMPWASHLRHIWLFPKSQRFYFMFFLFYCQNFFWSYIENCELNNYNMYRAPPDLQYIITIWKTKLYGYINPLLWRRSNSLCFNVTFFY